MGINTPYLPENLSIALGSSSLTPLEMGAAFSVFANNGHKIEPFGVKEILDSNGSVIEQNGPLLTDALSPETAVTLRSMLIQAVNWGTGTRARMDKEGYQVFGKTGTTNDWTDVWFVGGTPDLVTVVYVGNDDHKSLGRAFGGTVAAPVWKDFMTEAVKITNTPKQFKIPPGIGVESVSVCRTTGYLATKSCPRVINLLMPVGQAPETSCPWHGGSVTAARGDSNSPSLILTPEDDSLRSRYQLEWKDSETAQTIEPQPVPTLQDVAPSEESYMEPYQFDPAPAGEIEDRYQELLRQYNIY
jgi:penicillin-binding protein 1A